MSDPVRVGLYGANGHQVHGLLPGHPRARLVATAAFPAERLDPALAGARRHADLAGLLADDAVELVALCSPRRADQAADALRCLEAGRHVYAEKPCAMREADLDRILDLAARRGLVFREMAGTAFNPPYVAMRDCIAAGTIGEPVQVFAQVSYPWHDGRPDEEAIDGGLPLQVGVHAVRLIEHVTGLASEPAGLARTAWGRPRPGDQAMACAVLLRLANGGIASAIANYLNQPGMGSWGNYHLRVWGTRGFVESVDDGARTRLVVGGEDRGALPAAPGIDWFDGVCRLVRGDAAGLPLPVAAEVHPLRSLLRAGAALSASAG